MRNFLVYLTFIPWLLYFSSACKNSIKHLKDNKLTKEWLKKNIFQIFHFENIILIAIFVYFSVFYHDANQVWLANVLLFSAINLYLFFNSYYEKDKFKSKITTNDTSTILIIILLAIIPFIYYVGRKNEAMTYYILFAYSFFNYFIVYIAMNINKLLIKIIKRRNDKE